MRHIGRTQVLKSAVVVRELARTRLSYIESNEIFRIFVCAYSSGLVFKPRVVARGFVVFDLFSIGIEFEFFCKSLSVFPRPTGKTV